METPESIPTIINGAPQEKLHALLEDCHLCGEKGDLVYFADTDEEERTIWAEIKCRNCGTRGNTEENTLMAINAWNRLSRLAQSK